MKVGSFEESAKYLEAKAHRFADEHGLEDPDTGTLEFGNCESEDYYNMLLELAEELRALRDGETI